jgi:hypothetical protein
VAPKREDEGNHHHLEITVKETGVKSSPSRQEEEVAKTCNPTFNEYEESLSNT